MQFAQKYSVVVGFVLSCFCWKAQAQRPSEVVKWSIEVTKATTNSTQLTLSATVADGWHIYALSQPAGGPTPLKISIPSISLYVLQGPVADTSVVRHFDSNFNMETVYYLKTANFNLTLKPAGASAAETTPIDVRYQACSDRLCLPPYTAHLTAPLKRR